MYPTARTQAGEYSGGAVFLPDLLPHSSSSFSFPHSPSDFLLPHSSRDLRPDNFSSSIMARRNLRPPPAPKPAQQPDNRRNGTVADNDEPVYLGTFVPSAEAIAQQVNLAQQAPADTPPATPPPQTVVTTSNGLVRFSVGTRSAAPAVATSTNGGARFVTAAAPLQLRCPVCQTVVGHNCQVTGNNVNQASVTRQGKNYGKKG